MWGQTYEGQTCEGQSFQALVNYHLSYSMNLIGT